MLPGAPVGVAVVAKRRPLPLDAEPERPADRRRRSAATSLGVELARGRQRVDPRVPERLVGVDVPDSGRGPLVEEGRLDRRAAARERRAEARGRERAAERLHAEPAGGEVRLELARLEEVPRAEPAHVSVGDVRAVV